MADIWYTVYMSATRFTVRGVDDVLLNLMKVAAVRLRMTQAEALDSAIYLWLDDAMTNCPDRFAEVEKQMLWNTRAE